MRTAVIDIPGEILPEAARALADHSLQFVGTLPHDSTFHALLRFVIADEFNNLLPSQCDAGCCLVNARITQESYGKQRLAKVSSIEVVARLELAPDGVTTLRIAA